MCALSFHARGAYFLQQKYPQKIRLPTVDPNLSQLKAIGIGQLDLYVLSIDKVNRVRLSITIRSTTEHGVHEVLRFVKKVYVVIMEAASTAIKAIHNLDGTDRVGGLEVHLPPL